MNGFYSQSINDIDIEEEARKMGMIYPSEIKISDFIEEETE